MHLRILGNEKVVMTENDGPSEDNGNDDKKDILSLHSRIIALPFFESIASSLR